MAANAAEQVRILVCHHCGTVQELPWCGEDASCGHPMCVQPLEARISEHSFADGRPHAPANLAAIEKAAWDKYSTRQDILIKLKQIVDPGAGAGLGETLYDVKANYGADAAACWKRHSRTHNCGDYKTGKMRLVPDTGAERRDLGLSKPSEGPTKVFLCDFCPYKSIVQQRVHSDRYKYNYGN